MRLQHSGGRSPARMLVLAGTSLLALSASVATTRAAPVTFSYTGAIVTYAVQTTGTYDIIAYGAQGGSSGASTGWLGAEIGGDVTLAQREILSVAVGEQGNSGAGISGSGFGGGGGGGGSFVVAGSVPIDQPPRGDPGEILVHRDAKSCG